MAARTGKTKRKLGLCAKEAREKLHSRPRGTSVVGCKQGVASASERALSATSRASRSSPMNGSVVDRVKVFAGQTRSNKRIGDLVFGIFARNVRDVVPYISGTQSTRRKPPHSTRVRVSDEGMESRYYCSTPPQNESLLVVFYLHIGYLFRACVRSRKDTYMYNNFWYFRSHQRKDRKDVCMCLHAKLNP